MDETREDTGRFCFAWFAPRAAGGDNRAALLKKARWPHGSIITFSFLDGDPALHKRVIETALLWTAKGRANLKFAFRKGTSKADVRISFAHKGAWSLLGTDCKTQKDPAKPTMNLGWLKPDSPEETLRSAVLHEFGHVLGLIHEHQSPAGGIRWNKEQVYKDLSGPPYNWNSQTINANMFKAFEASETNFTKLDPRSIMMYLYPAKWTLDGFSTVPNSDLSPSDEMLIREMYP
jgi:serralysin